MKRKKSKDKTYDPDLVNYSVLRLELMRIKERVDKDYEVMDETRRVDNLDTPTLFTCLDIMSRRRSESRLLKDLLEFISKNKTSLSKLQTT